MTQCCMQTGVTDSSQNVLADLLQSSLFVSKGVVEETVASNSLKIHPTWQAKKNKLILYYILHDKDDFHWHIA